MATPKEIQLKKHKLFATSLFLLMLAIYLVTEYFLRKSAMSWIGYVHAFSEAAMVGALADWFAVTALFRYPMGLRIPHTNLIENKKNDIGENLGSFVKDNFLSEENIRPYIDKLDIAAWVSNWIVSTEHQNSLIKNANIIVKEIIVDLPDEDVKELIATKATEILNGIDYDKMIAGGLQYVLDNGEDAKLLDTLLPKILAYAEKSQDLIRERINEKRPLIGFLAGKKISKEFTQGIITFIQEIDEDKNHWVRKQITQSIEKLKNDVGNSDNWHRKLNEWKSIFISEEKLRPYINDAWTSFKTNFIEALDKEDSPWSNYLKKNVESFATRLHSDAELQLKINNWVKAFAYKMVLKNRGQVETIISNTVAGWKGEELSNKLELEIGKDLQFIRVNGTLVGGLVGLIIYTLTQLIFK